MWTNLLINLMLLSMSDYVFLLAASNVGYIIFNFLNLNAGWIHRIDRPNWDRPYKAPTILIVTGTILAYINMLLMGLGANVWGAGTLMSGLIVASLIIPIFVWRHYVVDRGRFPSAMLEDIDLSRNDYTVKRAGILPYLALAGGALVLAVGSYLS
jgi:amino acid transporter